MIYLAHGHQRRWEGAALQLLLEAWGHEVYNPFDGDPLAADLTQAWANAEARNNQVFLETLCPMIFSKDESHIKTADAVVVLYPEPSTGTAMEIQLAVGLGKKTVVLTDVVHPFVTGRATVLPLNKKGLLKLKEVLEEK